MRKVTRLLMLILVAAPGLTGAGDRHEEQGVSQADSRSDETDGDVTVEPGFPLMTPHDDSFPFVSVGTTVTLANLLGDSRPEIVFSSSSFNQGQLYAWSSDGTVVPGWPVGAGMARISVGRLNLPEPTARRRPAVAAIHQTNQGLESLVWLPNGTLAPGWPTAAAGFATVFAPVLADLDGDGVDELLADRPDGIVAVRHDGTAFPGWPVSEDRPWAPPAVADLDGDGEPEVVYLVCQQNGVVLLKARHADASMVAGFPVQVASYVGVWPIVVGDVDGDSQPEIVFVAGSLIGSQMALFVFSHDGVLQSQVNQPGSPSASQAIPALADLDGDGFPEVVVQFNEHLLALRGNGTALPGWPQVFPGHFVGGQSPVIGDVTGDGLPDVVIVAQRSGGGQDVDVFVYHANGSLDARFPRTMRLGANVTTPALGDIDGDGRNEIVLGSVSQESVPGLYPSVWALDLGGGPHGPVLWGQMLGSARHQGRYPPPEE